MKSWMAHRGLAIVLALLFVGSAARFAGADGVPEPGITMQGKVFGKDGRLLTQGRMAWKFTPYSGTGSPVLVSCELMPLVSATGTTYSYRIHVPAESVVATIPIAPDSLPLTTNLVVYEREATVDGAFTTVLSSGLTTTTFGYSERGKTERVDLTLGVNQPPGVPSSPSPANGAVLVPLTTLLDWADTDRAESYDLFLWQSGYTKPPAPTATGLTVSQYQPLGELRADTAYSWQVVARNSKGSTAGPTWTFRTAFQGDLQKLLEYLLGKRYLSFQEQMALDLNADANLDIADLILGLKRSALFSLLGATSVDANLVGQAGGASKTPSLLAPKTISIGNATVTRVGPVAVALPVNVSSTSGVAGINLKIEADPSLIQFTGVRPKQTNADEFLYHHSPYPGVLYVTFFANPVANLRASGSTVVLLDLQATLGVSGRTTPIRLKVAAVSDLTGVSEPSVTKVDGFVRCTVPPTGSRHWELYH